MLKVSLHFNFHLILCPKHNRNFVFIGKIQKGRQRLELMNIKSESGVISGPQTERNQEQIKLLTEKIAKLVEEAEQAGIRGDVEQAQGLMKLCDQLKEEKEQLQKQNENKYVY